MAMPEAAMYKDDCVEAWKYKVRAAGQVFAMKAEAQPTRVQAAAQD